MWTQVCQPHEGRRHADRRESADRRARDSREWEGPPQKVCDGGPTKQAERDGTGLSPVGLHVQATPNEYGAKNVQNGVA